MKKEVMVKWVEALRSGKYEQGTGALNSDGKFCCLGVLCEVMGVPKYGEGIFRRVCYGGPGDNSTGLLPISIREASGIRTSMGVYGDTNLANQNDQGKTFSEIADIIEKEWEEL